jgi:hypothetical protein
MTEGTFAGMLSNDNYPKLIRLFTVLLSLPLLVVLLIILRKHLGVPDIPHGYSGVREVFGLTLNKVDRQLNSLYLHWIIEIQEVDLVRRCYEVYHLRLR